MALLGEAQVQSKLGCRPARPADHGFGGIGGKLCTLGEFAHGQISRSIWSCLRICIPQQEPDYGFFAHQIYILIQILKWASQILTKLYREVDRLLLLLNLVKIEMNFSNLKS
jgi:hypothetical protein